MAKDSRIGWTNHTFNIVTGCVKVSPGCAHCYAERDRFARQYWGKTAERQTRKAPYWKQPIKWDREAAAAGVPGRVFAGSYCDVFEDNKTVDAEREKLWPLIEQTPNLRWLMLTKRAERIRRSLPHHWGSAAYSNVCLGISAENGQYLESRMNHLSQCGGNLRFVSLEPLLGPIDAWYWLKHKAINWVIVGGESGPGHRPMDPQWALEIQGQCKTHKVPFYYKQDGGPKSGTIEHPSLWRHELPSSFLSLN